MNAWGSGGIAPVILNLSIMWKPVIMPSHLNLGKRALCSHWIGAGWNPKPVCTVGHLTTCGGNLLYWIPRNLCSVAVVLAFLLCTVRVMHHRGHELKMCAAQPVGFPHLFTVLVYHVAICNLCFVRQNICSHVSPLLCQIPSCLECRAVNTDRFSRFDCVCLRIWGPHSLVLTV